MKPIRIKNELIFCSVFKITDFGGEAGTNTRYLLRVFVKTLRAVSTKD